jgi:hypothetical protein
VVPIKHLTSLALLTLLLGSTASAQDAESADGGRTYPFIIRDSPARLFTMRQFDQDYLSGYRLLFGLTGDNLSPPIHYALQIGSSFFILETMTHEEAHRSILVSQDIGSISQPFRFSERGGYVAGVTDQTLKNLRDTSFPTFIRLHTAGFESDYMLATREEGLLSFEDERYKTLLVEYWFRKAALVAYMMEGVFKHDTDGPEEANELERDIVGNDLYGAIRHLHRPTMEYKRYTRYADLTADELGHLKRVEWRTLLNLANVDVAGINNFRLSPNLTFNVGLGHCMGPFGDFIDEKVWLAYKRKTRVTGYLREFENKSNWFFGGGIGIENYPLWRRWTASASAHLWSQPVNLDFNGRAGKAGGAVDVSGSYDLLGAKKGRMRSFSLDVGMIYKTEGFLPEEVYLEKHFGLRFGLTLGF